MSQDLSSKKSLTYDEALERLYKISFFRRGKSVNCNAPILDCALGSPAKAYPAVHIAGTNGKGSVATKIAKALEMTGLKVGLFTSPHLLSFCERISINGKLIDQSSVADGLQKLFDLSLALKLKPTFFELVTILACLYFKEQEVDIAVFEVGLGGKTDATNVINPILSLITSISDDHNWILGETLELIAEQKAGIIRENIPVVLGPTAHFESAIATAKSKQAPIYFVQKTPGNFENENRAIAKTGLDVLRTRYALNDAIIEKAIKATPPCRFQELRYKGSTVIADVAHNPDAIEKLLQAISVRFPGRALHVLFGLSKDKDLAGCLAPLINNAKRIYLPDCKHERLTKASKLLECSHKLSYAFATKYETAEQSLEIAYENSKKCNGLILVCGSFYLMESVLPLLENISSSSASSA